MSGFCICIFNNRVPSYKLNRFPYSRWAVAAVAAAAFHSLRYFTVAKGKVLDTQNIEWLQSKREKQIIKIIKKKQVGILSRDWDR